MSAATRIRPASISASAPSPARRARPSAPPIRGLHSARERRSQDLKLFHQEISMRLFSRLSVLACLGVASLISLPVLAADPPAAPSPFNDTQKAGIETVVHDYLLKHPEIILQAV